MRKLHGLLALALMGASSAAMSQLPLNTGLKPDLTNISPGLPDNYWIKVAASGPPSSPAPALVITNPNSAWQSVSPSSGGFQSKWIGLTATGASPSGQVTYAIYRKCFCLTKGFQQATMNFKMRGDDVVGVWLNSSNVLPIQGGAFYGTELSGTATASQFQTGRNCVYVLVVDTGSVVTGFNLSGTVSAYGLMPMAATGADASFKPCTCEGPALASEQATLKTLVKIANGVVANGGSVQVKTDGPRSR